MTVLGHTTQRPHGPNHTRCGDHLECGVWVFNSTNLISWERTLTSWERTLTDVDPKLCTCDKRQPFASGSLLDIVYIYLLNEIVSLLNMPFSIDE